MDSMLSNATELWEDFWERRDKRMDDYPLMNNPLYTAIICCIYVFLVTFAGPRYMQDRKPMNLKSFLVLYLIIWRVGLHTVLTIFLKISANISLWLDMEIIDHCSTSQNVRPLLQCTWLPLPSCPTLPSSSRICQKFLLDFPPTKVIFASADFH